MAHNSPHHDDVKMSAELSEADQRRAIARLAGAYQQANRPPLTEAERRGREGDVILPFTPEMREDFEQVSTQNALVLYIALFLVIWVAIIGIVALLLDSLLYVAIFGPLLLAVPLYFLFARRLRARRAVAVNQMQSYHRYAGPCEIEEDFVPGNTGDVHFSWYYRVKMASPPALVPLIRFEYRDKRRHTELCNVTWGTIEYVPTRSRSILTIRDESDQVVYSYEEAQ